MDLFKPTIVFHGPVADHNMPCAVCRQGPAVYDFGTDVFEPCWHCQRREWRTMKAVKPMHAFFRWLSRDPESKLSRGP